MPTEDDRDAVDQRDAERVRKGLPREPVPSPALEHAKRAASVQTPEELQRFLLWMTRGGPDDLAGEKKPKKRGG